MKSIPIVLTSLPFLSTILALILVNFVFHLPIYLGLMCGWLVAFLIAKLYKYDVNQLLQASLIGMRQTSIVVSILLLIGALIAIWMASGTVASLILLSSHAINPSFMVVTAFCLSTMMSMLLGTSVGTLSTIGIVLVGIAQLNHIPQGLIGGALLSGAMVGDRTSPLSGTVHLLGNTVGVRPEMSYRTVIRSALPVFLVCLIAYGVLGYHSSATISTPVASTEIQQLSVVFHIHWLVYLPPLLVLVLALIRVPIRINLLVGLLFGMALTYIYQNVTIQGILYTCWFGSKIVANGQIVLQGGGVWNMFNQVLIILCAGALNGILDRTGMMEQLVGGLLERIKREGSLTLATMGVSILTGLVFCNQALMVILPGNIMRKKFDDLKVNRIELVRTLSDSGVVASALIPWNLHGILCSTAMGIRTFTYAPYAIFLWGLPVFAVIRAIYRSIRVKGVLLQNLQS